MLQDRICHGSALQCGGAFKASAAYVANYSIFSMRRPRNVGELPDSIDRAVGVAMLFDYEALAGEWQLLEMCESGKEPLRGLGCKLYDL
jgi:hypothetical protein